MISDIITNLRSLEHYLQTYSRLREAEKITDKEVQNLLNCKKSISMATKAITENISGINKRTNHKRK
jgi:hypothetical protein